LTINNSFHPSGKRLIQQLVTKLISSGTIVQMEIVVGCTIVL